MRRGMAASQSRRKYELAGTTLPGGLTVACIILPALRGWLLLLSQALTPPLAIALREFNHSSLHIMLLCGASRSWASGAD
jgi:hypothetical protein